MYHRTRTDQVVNIQYACNTVILSLLKGTKEFIPAQIRHTLYPHTTLTLSINWFKAVTFPIHSLSISLTSQHYKLSLLSRAFPIMAQRHKVLETDTPTAKFLYTIIKQLDLKSVSYVYDSVFIIDLTLECHRSIGTKLPPMFRYPTAMLLACGILGSDSRWMVQRHLRSSESPRRPRLWKPQLKYRPRFLSTHPWYRP